MVAAGGGACVGIGVYGYRDGTFGWGVVWVCGGSRVCGAMGCCIGVGWWLVCGIWELGVLSEA